MFINHFQVKGEEGLIQEHTQCSEISEEGVGEEETRSTNEAKAVETVATVAADRLEETALYSSKSWKEEIFLVGLTRAYHPL